MLDEIALLLYSRFLVANLLGNDSTDAAMTSVPVFYFGHNRLLLITFYHIRQLFPTIILDSLVCPLISNTDIRKHYPDKCDLTATYHI